MPPDRFVPIAEDAGLIQSIGDGVLLNETSRTMRDWRGKTLPAGRLAVNVSAAQLRRDDFSELVAALLTVIGSGGPALEIEIIESPLMTNVEIAACRLTEIRALGVGITLDDFGTGYSAFLPSQAPAHRCAQDRAGIARGSRRRGNGRASGVSRRTWLRRRPGNLFARPMTIAEFPAWLAEHVR